jgi:hypothetical protein
MKKIISRVILGAFMLWAICALLWKLIIQPCIELYAKQGWLGVGAWFVVLAIIGCVIYVIIEIVGWAIDNA